MGSSKDEKKGMRKCIKKKENKNKGNRQSIEILISSDVQVKY